MMRQRCNFAPQKPGEPKPVIPGGSTDGTQKAQHRPAITSGFIRAEQVQGGAILLKRNGSSGRTQIINQAYFQAHAGQRMTPKAMESNRKHANRARLERALRPIELGFFAQLTHTAFVGACCGCRAERPYQSAAVCASLRRTAAPGRPASAAAPARAGSLHWLH